MRGGGHELAAPRQVELDAAVLAANYSKAARSGSVGVNLCRARQVSKPAGAKPGLVQLSGDVRTLRLNWRNEKRRLERLRDALEG
jgi:predicted ribosome quality control (RQC) complex YloA/Tae2 family protein